MSMTTLPDLCLLAIFRHVPLRQFLHLGQVCQRWRTLQPIAGRQRKSICIKNQPTIVTNDSDLKLDKAYFANRFVVPECDTLSYKESFFPGVYWHTILEALPRVDTLTIVIDGVSAKKKPEAAIKWAHRWAPSPTTIRIFTNFSETDDESINEGICNIIPFLRCFKSLKQLTFENANFNANFYQDVADFWDISILSQLEQFEFKTNHALVDLFDSIILAAASNHNLRHIAIDNSIHAEDLPDLFLTNICNRMVHLYLIAPETIPGHILNQFYHHFAGSLTSLTLETSSQENVEFFSKLPNVRSFNVI